jgi:hypothetical protein
MKFFTLEAYHNTDDYEMQSLESWMKCYRSYEDHLEAMKGILLDSLLAIASQEVFGDGLITRVRQDHQLQKLEIRLRCGNLQIDYCDMILVYKGAKLSPEHDQILATIAGTTTWSKGWSFDCHNNEFDVNSEGEIIHRFLFNPGVCFEISCKSLTGKKVAKPGKRFAYAADRYPGGPETDESLVARARSFWTRAPDESAE